MDTTELMDTSICRTQGRIYGYMLEQHYDIELFSNTYLSSHFCERAMDTIYSRYQTEVPKECADFYMPEIGDLLEKTLETPSEADIELAKNVGFMYRMIYIRTSIPSTRLPITIPYKEMEKFCRNMRNYEYKEVLEEIMKKYNLPEKRYDSDFVPMTEEEFQRAQEQERLEHEALEAKYLGNNRERIHLALCRTQGRIYEYMIKRHYDIELFSNSYLSSDFCKRAMDTLYSRFQTEVPMECADFYMPEIGGLLEKTTETPSEADIELAKSIGFMYRMIYIHTSIPSAQLPIIIPYKEMEKFCRNMRNYEYKEVLEEIIKKYNFSIDYYDKDFIPMTKEEMRQFEEQEQLEHEALEAKYLGKGINGG